MLMVDDIAKFRNFFAMGLLMKHIAKTLVWVKSFKTDIRGD